MAMKILQISTYDICGGAARAASRLHSGLRETGQRCHPYDFEPA